MRKLTALFIVLLVTPLLFSAEPPDVYVAAPCIHLPSQGIFTAVALVNQTYAYSGESITLQSATVELAFIQGDEIITMARVPMLPGGVAYFHTGDYLTKDFHGLLVILTRQKIGGSVYVRGAGEQLTGEIRKVVAE